MLSCTYYSILHVLTYYFLLKYCSIRLVTIYVTVSAKTGLVHTKTEFNFIAAVYRHTQYPSIPVYQVLNVNWSAFLKGILPTLQSHGWDNWTHGGHQLDCGCLYLLPLAMRPTGTYVIGHCVGVMAAHGCPKGWFLPPPTPPAPPIPPHTTPPSIPPYPSIINADGRKGRQKIP